MRDNIKLSVAAMLGVLMPSAAWRAYEVFALNACDPKFGCAGGFQFILFILLICGFLSAVAISISSFILSKLSAAKSSNLSLVLVFCGSGILGALNQQFLANFNSVGSMILGWLLISFIGGSLIIWGTTKYNQALKQGSA